MRGGGGRGVRGRRDADEKEEILFGPCADADIQMYNQTGLALPVAIKMIIRTSCLAFK